MNSQDLPPPGHPPFSAGNDVNTAPQGPLGKEYSGSQYGCAPISKRSRNNGDYTPNLAPFIPTNPRTSRPQPNPPLNRGTSHIFYKTRVCAKFLNGNCSNGESCNFAHGQEDLRDPPPNWQEYVQANGKGAGGLDNNQRPIRGFKICRKFFYEKECPYGEKCNFLHEYPYNTDITRPHPMDISATSIGAVMEHRNDTGQTRLNKQLNAGSDALLVKTNPACLKTQNCTNLEITGQGQCAVKENFPRAHEQLGSSKTTVDAPTQVTEAKKFVNWRPPRKIAGIYGDWLDGYVLPDNN